MSIRTWEQMRPSIAERLVRQTGHDVEWWNARVTGYQQMLMVMERFGYPDSLLATSDELLEAQYHDRPQLRPILDTAVAIAATFGEVDVAQTWRAETPPMTRATRQ